MNEGRGASISLSLMQGKHKYIFLDSVQRYTNIGIGTPCRREERAVRGLPLF